MLIDGGVELKAGEVRDVTYLTTVETRQRSSTVRCGTEDRPYYMDQQTSVCQVCCAGRVLAGRLEACVESGSAIDKPHLSRCSVQLEHSVNPRDVNALPRPAEEFNKQSYR